MTSMNLTSYEDEDEDEQDYDEQRIFEDELSDDGREEDHNGGMAAVPSELKGLRACMVCSLIKTYTQFYDHGCDNCEPFLQMKERQDRVNELTSNVFEGLVAMQKPSESWVAKYQGIHMMKPGCYALEVTGEISPEIDEFLNKKNVPYRAKPPASSKGGL